MQAAEKHIICLTNFQDQAKNYIMLLGAFGSLQKLNKETFLKPMNHLCNCTSAKEKSFICDWNRENCSCIT